MVSFPGCQLASDFEHYGWPEGVSSMYLEPKLDGYRLSAVIDDSSVRFHCRDSSEVGWAANLGHIAEALLSSGFRNCMVDGEVMAEDWNKTGIVRRGASKKGYRPPTDAELAEIHATVKFHVFDWVDLDIGSLQVVKLPNRRKVSPIFMMPLSERRAILSQMVSSGHPVLKLTYAVEVTSVDQINEYVRSWIERGFEGGMAKRPDAPYEFERSIGWLKVKPVTTFELEVVGFEEGRGKLAGILGTLHCKKADGTPVSVGGGFTDAVRAQLWAIRDQLPGRILECKVQDSKVATARHPVFIRWRDDRTSL